MASTIELQTTLNMTSIFLRLQPLVSVGGFANEPAISIANQVMEFLLSAPLAWPWNRNTNATITTVAGTQNYSAAIADFGWLEKATINSGGTAVKELEIAMVLPEEVTQSRPLRIAAQGDDGAGNISFRLFPVPDAAYTLALQYQKAAPLFTSLTQTWAPIPDRFQHLYTTGFRALAYEMADDTRFAMMFQMFLSKIVEANNGLNEQQRNLFLWNKLRDVRQVADVEMRSEGGRNLVRE